MGSTYRDTQKSSCEQSDCTTSFCAETFKRSKFGNLLSHCFYNPPTSRKSAETHSSMTSKDNPQWYSIRNIQVLSGDKRDENNTHHFLSIIRSMTQIGRA